MIRQSSRQTLRAGFSSTFVLAYLILNHSPTTMIEPPRIHTEARREYDLRDLELLAQLAIEWRMHLSRSTSSSRRQSPQDD